MSKTRTRRLRAAVLLAGSAALVAGGIAAGGPRAATASSHREAPLISGQPQYDNTDVYAFVSPDKPDTTTLIANWIPFEDPAGGPNFYKFATDARYEIRIDNNGDSYPDLIYRWTFKDHVKDPGTFLYDTGPVKSLDDKNLNVTQTYDLALVHLEKGKEKDSETLLSDAPVAPSFVGKASMPDYAALRTQAVAKLAKGGQAFAGQADDPFFLDLRVFDLLYGGDLKEAGNDTLRGYNVNSVALQVPTSQLTWESPIVGIWSTTMRHSPVGDKWEQVSRLGNPLVNEVVIPLKDKDKFNATTPWDDGQFASYVTDPGLPKVIEAVYGIKAPAAPRNDLVQAFLTGVPGLNQPDDVRPAEMLRLNTSIPPAAEPKRLGVLDGDKAGFPNGRRLTDDVIDISLQVVEGKLLGVKTDLGDGVDANDHAFGTAFPYLALPNSGSDVKGAGPAAASGQQAAPSNGSSPGTQNSAFDATKPADRSMQAVMISGGVVLLLGFGVVLSWRKFRRPATAAAASQSTEQD
jgi:hypothetical protein